MCLNQWVRSGLAAADVVGQAQRRRGQPCRGGVARAEARLVRAKADFRRAEQMIATNAMSKEDHDKAQADMLEAEATVSANKAKIESDKAQVEAGKAKVRAEQLNLGYCSINAP